MNSRAISAGLAGLLVLGLSGCGVMNKLKPDAGSGQPAVTIDSVRGVAPFGLETKTKTVSRGLFRAALSKEGSINSARLVEIYQRGKSDDSIKEYRLLDVQPGSVYDLLGLEHADVIVAADGYIIPTPQMFWGYLNLIGQYEEGKIEIRRADQPMLISFNFIE